MTIRTLCCAVLGVSLSGLVMAGDSPGRGYNEYRDQDRRGQDYRRDNDRVVILAPQRYGRDNDRYDRGDRHQGHRDNRDYRDNRWRDGYRDQSRDWDRRGRGHTYYQGNTYYVVPQQQYYYRPQPIRRDPGVSLQFNFR